MKIKRPLLILAAGFVLGEVLGLQMSVAVKIILWLVAGAAVSLMVTARRRAAGEAVHSDSHTEYGAFRIRTGRSLWLWLLPVFVFAGMMRADWVRNACEKELGLELSGRRMEVCGTVRTVEEREDGGLIVVMERCEGVWGECETEREETAGQVEATCRERLSRLQVYLDAPENDWMVFPGNRIRVTGTVQAYDRARNPGEFDYRLYYRSLKLNYRMFADQCEILDGRKDFVRYALLQFGWWASGILEQTADPEEAGIYRAVILGDKSGMNPSVRNLYQKSGIAHLLAVSGLHLSMVSMAAYGGLRKLGTGYGKAGILGGAVLAAYAVLTGASPSVLRALIMALCGFLAAYLGRTYDLMSALSLAALCLFWDSPYRICQAGVQLSFGALIGIGWLAPCLTGEVKRELQIRQALLVSMSMQLVTLPPILYHFFQYPLYGIFLNFLVVPLMGGVVASGTGGILLGAWNRAAGRFALGTGHWILCWYELCCRIFAKLPGYVLMPGRSSAWKMGVYYGSLMALAWRRAHRLEHQKQAGREWLPVMVSILLLMVPAPVHGLQVTFLDVGQGDGICMQSGKEVVLVDGGSTDETHLGKNRLAPFLKSRGISKVTCAVVSHGDQDHISGLRYLLEEEPDIQVEQLVLPAAGRGDVVYGELEALALRRGSRILWMESGEALSLKGFSVTCLYPSKEQGEENDRNCHSLVLRVDYGGFHMLLTGDMTGEGEQELLRRTAPGTLSDIQVLKIAHHGSEYSTTEEWLEAVGPQWAVISYGEGNRYGHPHDAVLERLRGQGSAVFETAKSGAVMLRTDGEKIWWEVFGD
ncbi:MAG: DNA internalization-related competence protein ComEC/Rec2 [Eubacteriales bacterium]|nr:DNA internalization-related competence protein ComEC/Rec2 [Eubacteriales bacterium]